MSKEQIGEPSSKPSRVSGQNRWKCCDVAGSVKIASKQENHNVIPTSC